MRNTHISVGPGTPSIVHATIVSAALIGGLYWAQAVFIPLAVAIFLTFLLSPLVKALQGWRLNRTFAVTLVVLCASLLLSGLFWTLARQVTGIVAELPNYKTNIKEKVRVLRDLGEGPAKRFEAMIDEIATELQSPLAQNERFGPPSPPATETEPHAVAVLTDSRSWLAHLPNLSSAVDIFASLALAFVLLFFMLLNREELRNRFIRLVGDGRLSFTTKAVDEATQRISRYLIAQAFLNGAFGIIVTIVLAIFGVQYAVMWGLLAAVLRYVPYVGIWVSAVFPMVLSLAMSAGWWQPLAIFGMYLILEIIAANVLEPWLFGHSAGISQVALLLAAAFWTFLWGPFGLVLSTPLTVCLVVLGKYCSQLQFLNVLLGDQPALDPVVTFYQRMLARDQDEATDLVLAQIKNGRAESVYDELLAPALGSTRRDRARDDISDDDETFCQDAIREILADIGETLAAASSEADKDKKALTPVHIMGAPARNESDRLALEMLNQVLDHTRWQMEVAAEEVLAGELLERVADAKPAVIVIGSLPPGGISHTRYLCKRLRAHWPDVKIIVGRWGLPPVADNHEQLLEGGADSVSTSILDTRHQLNVWRPVLADELHRGSDDDRTAEHPARAELALPS